MSAKSVRLDYIDVIFGPLLGKCNDYRDDRGLFVVMVENLREAVVEFESATFKNSLIELGFTLVFDQKRKEIDDLVESLKKRGMI